MEQSTQTSNKDVNTSSSETGSPRYSEYEINFDNIIKPSPRYMHQLLPAKTHLGFHQRGAKTHTTTTTTGTATATAKTSGLLSRRPRLVDANKCSPRKQVENGVVDLSIGASSKHVNGGDRLHLVNDATSAERANRRTRLAAAEHRQMERRAAAKERTNSLSPLFVRSNTVALGHIQKPNRPIKQGPPSAASNGRQCHACAADQGRHWLKHPNSAPDKRKSEVLETVQMDKSPSSPDSDRVNMTYSYYMPIQLMTQDDEDKSNQRDMAALTTVSLPKKGRLKLTGLQYELNNPEVYDNNREESKAKEQQKTYHEELMGPALPHYNLDLYRGPLLRNKSILKQVKQGEQLLEQEEDAVRHQKHWRDHDTELVDLIKQLLHYDMPEVPTINKNLHVFAGIPDDSQPSPPPPEGHQTDIEARMDGDSKSSLFNSSTTTTNNNNNYHHNRKNHQYHHNGSNGSSNHICNDVSDTSSTVGYNNNNNNSSSSKVTMYHHQQPHDRRLKSRSAQEHRVQGSDLELQLPINDSPRSLNLSSLQTSSLPTQDGGSASARSLRGDVVGGGGARSRTKERTRSDWLSVSPWGHYDSLHGVLAHAQKITLNRANIKRK